MTWELVAQVATLEVLTAILIGFIAAMRSGGAR